MSFVYRLWIGTVIICLIASTAGAGQRKEEKPGTTLAPYFFIEGGDPAIDRMPLKSTRVKAEIAGVIARVTIIQKYANKGSRAINGSYIFPASTRAAVHGMTMKIGDEVIHARVRKKEEAKQEFKVAQKEGKSAALLSEHRPNVFSMKVANVMPGDELEVTLEYTELLEPREGEYDFVFPTVVGPRYSCQTEKTALQDEQWIKNPYLRRVKPGQDAPAFQGGSLFNIDVRLAAAMPIQEARSISHEVKINWQNDRTADITLAKGPGHEGDHDFILKYRLAGKKITTGFMHYTHTEDEKYFLLMMEPPERAAIQKPVPGEYIFVVDVSGSMHGFPLDTAKKLLKKLTKGLRPVDRFNMVFFAGGSKLLSPVSLPATPDNIRLAVRAIENQKGRGGTELAKALKRGLALPHTEGVSRTMLVLTDGYISFERETFNLIRNNLNHANVFAFGIGSSVNRYLVEGIARAGLGEGFIATSPDETDAVAARFRKYVASPLLTDIRISFKGFDAYDVEPAGPADIFASRPIIVYGKYRGNPQGEIVVSGSTGTGRYEQRIRVEDTAPDSANSALRYLWARKKIARISDFNHSKDEETKAEIATLGLTYNLLTTETSFIAVSEQIRNPGGRAENVKQPLPLPLYVSNLAVGGRSVPEPEFYLLLILALILFRGMGKRKIRNRRQRS
jgi:Ca-activated chloride channel family protein